MSALPSSTYIHRRRRLRRVGRLRQRRQPRQRRTRRATLKRLPLSPSKSLSCDERRNHVELDNARTTLYLHGTVSEYPRVDVPQASWVGSDSAIRAVIPPERPRAYTPRASARHIRHSYFASVENEGGSQGFTLHQVRGKGASPCNRPTSK